MQNVSSRNFSQNYVYQAYPKWVTAPNGARILVRSAEEEAVLLPKEDPEERRALIQEAQLFGLHIHHRTGIEKIKDAIAEAKQIKESLA